MSVCLRCQNKNAKVTSSRVTEKGRETVILRVIECPTCGRTRQEIRQVPEDGPPGPAAGKPPAAVSER